MKIRGEPDIQELVRLFSTQLADAQRGEPESAMNRIQEYGFSNLYSWAAEHTGDLTHRMAERSAYHLGGGYAYVKDKVEKVLRALLEPYGFEKEVNEGITSNVVYRDVKGDLEKHQKTLQEVWAGQGSPEILQKIREGVDLTRKLGNDYANAHAALPVFNQVQKAARDAAIALGRWNFPETIRLLQYLKSCLDQGRDAWIKMAFSYEPEIAGDQAMSPVGRVLNLFAQLRREHQFLDDRFQQAGLEEGSDYQWEDSGYHSEGGDSTMYRLQVLNPDAESLVNEILEDNQHFDGYRFSWTGEWTIDIRVRAS